MFDMTETAVAYVACWKLMFIFWPNYRFFGVCLKKGDSKIKSFNMGSLWEVPKWSKMGKWPYCWFDVKCPISFSIPSICHSLTPGVSQSHRHPKTRRMGSGSSAAHHLTEEEAEAGSSWLGNSLGQFFTWDTRKTSWKFGIVRWSSQRITQRHTNWCNMRRLQLLDLPYAH